MKEMIYADIQKYEENLEMLKAIREELLKRKKFVTKVDINNPYINAEIVEQDQQKIDTQIAENLIDIKMCKGVIRRLNTVLTFDNTTDEIEEASTEVQENLF